MPNRSAVLTKRTLDKDLDKLTHVEDATKFVSRKLVAPGLGLIFLGLAMLFAGVYVFDRPSAVLVIAAPPAATVRTGRSRRWARIRTGSPGRNSRARSCCP